MHMNIAIRVSFILFVMVLAAVILSHHAHAFGEEAHRIEAVAGYSSGKVNSDYLDGSVSVGNGPALGLNFWKDGAFDTEMVSLGFGYKYHQHKRTFTVANYSGSAELNAHDLLLKLAIRDSFSYSEFKPYAGFGMGVTHMNTDISDETANGYTLSGFLGIDYDIPDSQFYIGAETSYTRTWATVYDTDFTLNSFDGLAKIGIKF